MARAEILKLTHLRYRVAVTASPLTAVRLYELYYL
jgi:hypothetical protein